MRSSLTGLTLVLLALATGTVAGCGLKGDLYLPEKESAEPSAVPDDQDGEMNGDEPPSGDLLS